jgi:mono/diheme cytochrome c family protein
MRKVIVCGAALLLTIWGVAARASSAELIAKGEYLARAGDCVVCHTGPGERPFSGGLKMATPLGNIFTTNITPDKETGIGDYSYEDFERAIRRGIARDGHRLYPAMPYPSYARITDDDVRALYAFFLESVPPARRPNSPSEIRSPLNIRWPIALWDAVFTAGIGYTPDPAHDSRWNRGAYLVQGLGHCGSCHTPRGIFFQEKALDQRGSAYLAGGNLDDWYASSLRGNPGPGLGAWSEADIALFLKSGHNAHASAYGTMIDAINNSTQYLTDDDLAGIAAYLKSLTPSDTGAATQTASAGPDTSSGAKLYAQQCAACHLAGGQGHAPYIAPLAGNPTINDADPASLINITLNGSSRIVVEGMPDAYRMPQYRVLLRDGEIADIVNFMRASWSDKATPVTAEQVGKIRRETEPASDAVVILKMR